MIMENDVNLGCYDFYAPISQMNWDASKVNDVKERRRFSRLFRSSK